MVSPSPIRRRHGARLLFRHQPGRRRAILWKSGEFARSGCGPESSPRRPEKTEPDRLDRGRAARRAHRDPSAAAVGLESWIARSLRERRPAQDRHLLRRRYETSQYGFVFQHTTPEQPVAVETLKPAVKSRTRRPRRRPSAAGRLRNLGDDGGRRSEREPRRVRLDRTRHLRIRWSDGANRCCRCRSVQALPMATCGRCRKNRHGTQLRHYAAGDEQAAITAKDAQLVGHMLQIEVADGHSTGYMTSRCAAWENRRAK